MTTPPASEPTTADVPPFGLCEHGQAVWRDTSNALTVPGAYSLHQTAIMMDTRLSCALHGY